MTRGVGRGWGLGKARPARPDGPDSAGLEDALQGHGRPGRRHFWGCGPTRAPRGLIAWARDHPACPAPLEGHWAPKGRAGQGVPDPRPLPWHPRFGYGAKFGRRRAPLRSPG